MSMTYDHFPVPVPFCVVKGKVERQRVKSLSNLSPISYNLREITKMSTFYKWVFEFPISVWGMRNNHEKTNY